MVSGFILAIDPEGPKALRCVVSSYSLKRGVALGLLPAKPEYGDVVEILERAARGEADPREIDEVLDGKFLAVVEVDGSWVVLRDPAGFVPAFAHPSGDGLLLADSAFPEPRPPGWVPDVAIRLYPWHVYKLRTGAIPCLEPVCDAHGLVSPPPDSSRPSLEEAARWLCRYMVERMAGLAGRLGVKRVYVSYSGGVDSSLAARVAQEAGLDVVAVTACLEGSEDAEIASRHARMLGIEHWRVEVPRSLSDLEADVEEVVRVIEDFSPVSVSVGLAQYWVMRALERGSVLVVGQGSDEAYGGYQRFADAYREGGEKAAAWEVRRSIIHSYRVNFEREWRLSLHLGVEILYPLISPGMVYYVGRLPLAARVRGPDDALRKHIVRLAASAMGVPREIAGARKRSMQYSTGAMKALRDVARAHGLKPHQYLYKKYMDLFAGQGGGPGLG